MTIAESNEDVISVRELPPHSDDILAASVQIVAKGLPTVEASLRRSARSLLRLFRTDRVSFGIEVTFDGTSKRKIITNLQSPQVFKRHKEYSRDQEEYLEASSIQ